MHVDAWTLSLKSLAIDVSYITQRISEITGSLMNWIQTWKNWYAYQTRPPRPPPPPNQNCLVYCYGMQIKDFLVTSKFINIVQYVYLLCNSLKQKENTLFKR